MFQNWCGEHCEVKTFPIISKNVHIFETFSTIPFKIHINQENMRLLNIFLNQMIYYNEFSDIYVHVQPYLL